MSAHQSFLSKTRLTRRDVLKTTAAGLALPTVGGVAAADETRTVVDFNDVGPENLAIDDEGHVYMTMNLSGEIRRLDFEDALATGLDIDDTALVATLPAGGGFTTGIAEAAGDLYVALPAFSDDDRGVWRVPPGGPAPTSPFAHLPDSGLLNGVLHDVQRHRLLVTDSFLGRIWSVELTDGAVDTWSDDALLDPGPFIGANGIAMDKRGDVFVAHLDHGRVLRIPMGADGSAGAAEVVVEDARLVGADGLTFHRGTTLYVAVNGQDRVVRITPSGRIHTVVDASDGLDFPADVAFGTTRHTNGKLFVANLALDRSTFQIEGDPSLMLTHP